LNLPTGPTESPALHWAAAPPSGIPDSELEGGLDRELSRRAAMKLCTIT
jgi:hypothetical protein